MKCVGKNHLISKDTAKLVILERQHPLKILALTSCADRCSDVPSPSAFCWDSLVLHEFVGGRAKTSMQSCGYALTLSRLFEATVSSNVQTALASKVEEVEEVSHLDARKGY